MNRATLEYRILTAVTWGILLLASAAGAYLAGGK